MSFKPLVLAASGVLSFSPMVAQADSESLSKEQTIALIADTVVGNINDSNRDAHPKAHACLANATFEVDKNLKRSHPYLAHGIFGTSTPNKYPAIVRMSHGASDPRAVDAQPGGHGLAVKLLLPGKLRHQVPKMTPDEQLFEVLESVPKEVFYKTFDIIGISGPSEFLVNTLDDYLEFLQATAAVKQRVTELIMDARRDGRAPDPRQLQAESLRIMDELYFKPGTDAARVTERRLFLYSTSEHLMDPTAATYDSFVPSYLYLDQKNRRYAVKYRWSPCYGNPSQAYNGSVLREAGTDRSQPNFLQEVIRHRLAEDQELCFDLKVQIKPTSVEYSEVNLAALEWPEKDWPYIKVGSLNIKEQSRFSLEAYGDYLKQVLGADFGGSRLGDSSLLSQVDGQGISAEQVLGSDGVQFCNSLSFNPGHAPAAHAPAGDIQEARKVIYQRVHEKRRGFDQ